MIRCRWNLSELLLWRWLLFYFKLERIVLKCFWGICRRPTRLYHASVVTHVFNMEIKTFFLTRLVLNLEFLLFFNFPWKYKLFIRFNWYFYIGILCSVNYQNIQVVLNFFLFSKYLYYSIRFINVFTEIVNCNIIAYDFRNPLLSLRR